MTLPFLRAARSISFPLRSNLCTSSRNFRLPSADKSSHQAEHILCSPKSSLGAALVLLTLQRALGNTHRAADKALQGRDGSEVFFFFL